MIDTPMKDHDGKKVDDGFIPYTNQTFAVWFTHRVPGKAFRLLAPDAKTAFAMLHAISNSEVQHPDEGHANAGGVLRFPEDGDDPTKWEDWEDLEDWEAVEDGLVDETDLGVKV